MSGKNDKKSNVPSWLYELDWDKMNNSKRVGVIAALVFVPFVVYALATPTPTATPGDATPTPEATATATPEFKSSFKKADDGLSYIPSEEVIDLCDTEAISKGYEGAGAVYRTDHPSVAYETGDKVDGAEVFQIRSAIGREDKSARKKQGLETDTIYNCYVADKDTPKIIWLEIDGSTVSGKPIE